MGNSSLHCVNKTIFLHATISLRFVITESLLESIIIMPVPRTNFDRLRNNFLCIRHGSLISIHPSDRALFALLQGQFRTKEVLQKSALQRNNSCWEIELKREITFCRKLMKVAAHLDLVNLTVHKFECPAECLYT